MPLTNMEQKKLSSSLSLRYPFHYSCTLPSLGLLHGDELTRLGITADFECLVAFLGHAMSA